MTRAPLISLALIVGCSGKEQPSADVVPYQRVVQEYEIATPTSTYNIGFLCELFEIAHGSCPDSNKIVSVTDGKNKWNSILVTDKKYCPVSYEYENTPCYEGLYIGTRNNAWSVYVESTGFDVTYRQNLDAVIKAQKQ